MKRLMFLGDIHGDFNIVNQYLKLYDITDAFIIQVGDFGVGFRPFIKEKRSLEYVNNELVKRNVTLFAIRGNHDFKPYFDNDTFQFTNIKLVPDYTVLNLCERNILVIGGAVSVDRKLRTKKNWWPDEVFNFDKDKLERFKDIDMVVTHTCPFDCYPNAGFGVGQFVTDMITRTGDLELETDLLVERNLLTQAFEILKKNNTITNHFYGHFHTSNCEEIDGIKHRLLAINELYEER